MNKSHIKENIFEIGCLYKIAPYSKSFDLQYPVDKDIALYTGASIKNNCKYYNFYLLIHKMNAIIYHGWINKDPRKSAYKFEKI